MSEAYILSGAAAAAPSEAIQSAQAAARARSAWIEEVFVLTARRDLILPELPANVPVSCWPNQAGLDGFVLQTACRLLASEERRHILIIQQGRARSVAVLLVGPQAIGVYNLAPLAQVHPGWTLPGSGQPGQAAAAALDKAEVDRSTIRWLAANLPPEDGKANFPAARLVARTPPGLIFKLQVAARSLKTSSPLAVLIDTPVGQPVRVFLVEKL